MFLRVQDRTGKLNRPSSLTQLLVSGICLSAIAAGSWFTWLPQPPCLGETNTGDAVLAARVRAAVGEDIEGFNGIAVGFLDGGRTTFAGLGNSGNSEYPEVDSDTVFEVGSIGKPMTGMLLTSLAEHRRLDMEKPLAELLPRTRISDPALADATLTDLVTHRSGLEPMPAGLSTSLRELELRLLGNDPYQGLTDQDVFTAAANASVITPGEYRYSNFGMALAGQTAARVAGTPYEELLDTYLLTPLGMKDTDVVPVGLSTTHRKFASGVQETGPPVDHWTKSGFTPAGDISSTSRDLAVFLRAVSSGTAPGMAATQRVSPVGPDEYVGLGWNIKQLDGREILWHNGETAGFTSYIGLDRTENRGVVVLSNTNKSVDALGQHLLNIRNYVAEDADGTWQVAVTVALSLGAGSLALWTIMTRAAKPGFWVFYSIDLLCGMVLLALTWRLGAWLTVSPHVWGLGICILTAGIWGAHFNRASDAYGINRIDVDRKRIPVVAVTRFLAGRLVLLLITTHALL